MIRTILVLLATVTISGGTFAQGAGMREFPEQPRIGAPEPRASAERLRVVDVFAPGTGLVQLVIRGNEVITGEFIPISQMSQSEILQSQYASDGGIPNSTVVIDNETITVIQLTFPDGSVVFVVIHKESGTMTVIEDPEGP